MSKDLKAGSELRPKAGKEAKKGGSRGQAFQAEGSRYLEALPAPAICLGAVVPKRSLMDFRSLSKHDCDPLVIGSDTLMHWGPGSKQRAVWLISPLPSTYPAFPGPPGQSLRDTGVR